MNKVTTFEPARKLKCGHDQFHDKCVSSWVDSHNQCPLCRAIVDEEKEERKNHHDSDDDMHMGHVHFRRIRVDPGDPQPFRGLISFIMQDIERHSVRNESASENVIRPPEREN